MDPFIDNCVATDCIFINDVITFCMFAAKKLAPPRNRLRSHPNGSSHQHKHANRDLLTTPTWSIKGVFPCMALSTGRAGPQ